MSCLSPAEFVTKMVDAGESKLLMSTRDTLIDKRPGATWDGMFRNVACNQAPAATYIWR